jgi:hypothetical protein
MNKYIILPAVLVLLSCGCIRSTNTPERALTVFWEAMARSDPDAVLRTMIYYEEGMTSEDILTPQNIEWLHLDSMRTNYDNKTRARIYYQVVFKKNGSEKTTRYKTGTMMIKRDGRWKVGRAIGREL